MIRIDTVSFSYGMRPALSGLSLQVKKGEWVGLIGPNSSGKSTLLKLISRDLRPQAGRIELLGRPIDAWPLQELARTLTVVSSEDQFIFPFTVQQIVMMGRTPYIPRGRRESVQDHEAVQRAMELTDVLALRDRPIQGLSSGERQRVLLARALAQQPQILLLDEPSVHLDITHEWRFFELLRYLHAERGLTIICALHDLALGGTFCDRLVMLRAGKIRHEGTPRNVLNSDAIQDVFDMGMSIEWKGENGQSQPVLVPQQKGRPDA